MLAAQPGCRCGLLAAWTLDRAFPAGPAPARSDGHGGAGPAGPAGRAAAGAGRGLAVSRHDERRVAPVPRPADRRPRTGGSGRHPGVDPLALVRAVGQLVRAGQRRLRRLDAGDAGGAAAGAAAAHAAQQADRDRPRAAAGVALRQARRARHLADAGAVWRQSGGRAGRRAGLVRHLGRGARPGAGGAAGRPAAPAGGAAAGPASRGSRARCATGCWRRRRACRCRRARVAVPAPCRRRPWRGAWRRPGACGPRSTCRCRSGSSGWWRSGWTRCRSGPRSPCWSPMPAAREIRALVSGRWGDEARAGELDLTRAVRSPGSALKPFLYALAFQDGLARPDTRADRPAAAFRRLCAGELRPRACRAGVGGGGAAAVAEPAGGGAAGPGGAAALRGGAARRRAPSRVCRRAPTRRCRWRWAGRG